jgi:hypothetical protein
MEGKLDLARVHKKLAEAQFFLSKMIEQERRIFRGGDPREPFEPFDYYLSAFLSAGRTVDYRLRHEQAVIYPAWRTAWDASLTPQENSLIKFMVDDRNVEVHASGSSRGEAREGVEFGIGTHHVDGGMIAISGPPGMPHAVVDKRTFNFTIDGAVCKAAEACADYIALLQRMVARFEADHP